MSGLCPNKNVEWHRHNGEAEAWGEGRIKRYTIKPPYAPSDPQLEVWCNGNRMCKVDTIDEGINLCEWIERSGNC